MRTAKPRRPHVPGRSWAITGFLLGSLVSIGGNVQAVWLPADDPKTPDNWMPSIPSQVGAIVWPLALMVSVEVLSRISWPEGWGWRAVRLLGIGAVAGGSAVISYGHIYAVLRAWGYGPLGAGVGPLVVDGLMLICGFALVSIGKTSRTTSAATTVPADEPSAPPREASAAPRVPVRQDVAPMNVPASKTLPAPASTTPPAVQEAPTVVLPAVTVPTAPSRPAREASVPASRSAARQEAPASRSERPAVQAPPASRPATNARDAAGDRENTAAEPQEAGTPGGRLSDTEALREIRTYRSTHGELPSANWMKQNLGMGAGRAARLLQRVDQPDADLVELHTVQATG